MKQFASETRVLTFNTRGRDRSRYPDPADCRIEFPEPYRMVTRVALAYHAWPSGSRAGVGGALLREGENDTLEFCEGLRAGSGHKFSTSFWVVDADNTSVAALTAFPGTPDGAMASLPAYYNPVTDTSAKPTLAFAYPHAMFPQPRARHFLSKRGANTRLHGGARDADPQKYSFAGTTDQVLFLANNQTSNEHFLHTQPLTKQEIADTVNAYPASFRATLRFRDGRFVFRLKSRHAAAQKICWPDACDTLHCLAALGFGNGQAFDPDTQECVAYNRPQYHFRATVAAGRWAEQGASNVRHALLHELNKGSLLACNTDPATTGETVQASAIVSSMPVQAQKQGALAVVYSDGDVRPLSVGIYQRFRTPHALAAHLESSWKGDPTVKYESALEGIDAVKAAGADVQINLNDDDPAHTNTANGNVVRLVDLHTNAVRFGKIKAPGGGGGTAALLVTSWFLDYQSAAAGSGNDDRSPRPDWYTKTEESEARWRLTVFDTATEVPTVRYDEAADRFTFRWAVAGATAADFVHTPVSLTLSQDLVRPTVANNLYDNGLSRQLAGMLGLRAGGTYAFARTAGAASTELDGAVVSEVPARWPRHRRTWRPTVTGVASATGVEDALADPSWSDSYEYPAHAYRFAYSGASTRPLLAVLADTVVFRGDGLSSRNAGGWITGMSDVFTASGSSADLLILPSSVTAGTRTAAAFGPEARFELLHDGVEGSIGRRIGLDRDFPAGANRVDMARTYDRLADQHYMVTLSGVPSLRQSAEAIVYDPDTGRPSGKASVVAVVSTSQGWSHGATPANSLDLYDPANIRALHVRLVDQTGTRTYSTDGQDITYSFVFTVLVPTGHR